MTGWCPYKDGTLKEAECHHDGYCSDCPYKKDDDKTENKRVIRYKLLGGSIHDCDYANEEEMVADTEARGLTVIAYWIDI